MLSYIYFTFIFRYLIIIIRWPFTYYDVIILRYFIISRIKHLKPASFHREALLCRWDKYPTVQNTSTYQLNGAQSLTKEHSAARIRTLENRFGAPD